MKSRTVRFVISVPTTEIETFQACCEEAGWSAFDVGDRITTESGLEGEAVLMVEAPVPGTRKRSALVMAL